MIHYYDITAKDRNGNFVLFRNIQASKLIGFDTYFFNKEYQSAIFYYKPAPSGIHPLIHGMALFVVAGTWDQDKGYRLTFDPRNSPRMKYLRGISNYLFGTHENPFKHRNCSGKWVRRW